jgi:hypothetical protein
MDIHLENTDGSEMVRGNLVPLPTRDYEPVDFASVMFYWTTAFSIDALKPTIVLKKPYDIYQQRIGTYDVPSALDLKDVADAYGAH